MDGLNEELVRGRERLYFGHQFATKAARPLPEHAVRQYTDPIAAGPEALSAAFGFYRELDRTMAQNQRRKERPLTIPVLTIAGADSLGGAVGGAMRLAAEDVREVILPQCGHYPAEEAPEATLAALTAFLSAR
jgi:pimeloyl-ACP methyl ester carboxylesterase